MTGKMISSALVALAMLVGGQMVEAQNLDLSGLVAQNMAFDQQMMQNAYDFSVQWYNDVQAWRARTGDYTTPVSSGFNASTLNAANLANSAAFDARNQGWWANQNTYANTYANYGRSAVRGNALYANPTGNVYSLPYTHRMYWGNGNGYAVGSNDGSSPYPYTFSTPLRGYGW